MFISGDDFFSSYKHTVLVVSPQKHLLTMFLIWLLLITCCKDSVWVTRRNSTASMVRIHLLKLLQSKALTGTLVREFFSVKSAWWVFFFLFLCGRELGANKDMPFLPDKMDSPGSRSRESIRLARLCRNRKNVRLCLIAALLLHALGLFPPGAFFFAIGHRCYFKMSPRCWAHYLSC